MPEGVECGFEGFGNYQKVVPSFTEAVIPTLNTPRTCEQESFYQEHADGSRQMQKQLHPKGRSRTAPERTAEMGNCNCNGVGFRFGDYQKDQDWLKGKNKGAAFHDQFDWYEAVIKILEPPGTRLYCDSPRWSRLPPIRQDVIETAYRWLLLWNTATCPYQNTPYNGVKSEEFAK
ncbi:hypothetical protein BT63DRAFT_414594 [Microthyrium microscopicum]|uniref:Uncharacterized protein n=1 Tax=Microthyrium microscopicum TaxID=703497 RepID=A0A6A6U9H5_9PEZI|nr:hypothetical protein BT63DRAFT_414594 [Microthyrium microscopicum]